MTSQTCDTAIILAGGVSTFSGLVLAPYPKLLLPIANRSLYHYMAAVLREVGVKQMIFCVGPGMAPEVANSLTASPPKLAYRVQETANGPGGSVKEAAAWIEGDSFWVVNGDLLLGTDLAPMLAWHRQRGAMATVGSMMIREEPWWMERVELDGNQSVRAIHRVHPMQERRTMLRPMGIYLFHQAILDFIPHEGYFDLKEQLFSPLYEQGITSGAWEIKGYCRTITSIEDYFFANQDVLLGAVQIPDTGNPPGSADSPSPPPAAPGARFFEPLAIGPDTRIGEEAMVLGPTAIGPHCQVGSGSIVNECVILGNVRIGRGVYLDGCVLAAGAAVADGAIMRETAVLRRPSGEEARVALALRDRLAPRFGEPQWQTPAARWYLPCKRLLDILVAAFALVICAPVMLLLALAIRLDSPGKAIFRQQRCGKKGRAFTMYKYRTMVPHAEDLKRGLQIINEVDGPMFKLTNDPRLTRLGRFLRNTNLDELPQLWNVLKGEMSLVGPRPLSMEEMQYNPRWRDARLAVRPGMTGLWQVETHTGLNFGDWIQHDINYVHHLSWGLDLNILLRTMRKVIRDCVHPWRDTCR